MNTKIPVVPIYGIPVSKMTMQETVDYLTQAVQERQPHQVVTANPIMVMAGLDDPNYMSMLRSADLVVPDGAGLVWAANYVGTPVPERVAGYDLMHELFKVGEKHRWKAYLVGASPEVIGEAARKLQLQYPLIQFVGVRDGYFGPEEDAKVIEQIRLAEPDLLFVGRSADRQDPWIGKYREQLNVPVMMGIGGSFDVVSGKIKRAPKLMQRMRLEWFYRLAKEPWRFKRMLALPKFALKVIREKDRVRNS